MTWGLQRPVPRLEQVDWQCSHGGRMGASPLQACFLLPGSGLRCLNQLAPSPSVGDAGVLREQSRPLDRPGGEQPLQG